MTGSKKIIPASYLAFTLIELMAVTLLLSIIGVFTGVYLRTTFQSQKKIEEKTNLQQIGTSVINRLTDDITQVFFVESYQKLTFFKGDAHSISFTSLSHDAANPNERESDQAKISYTLEDDTLNTESQTKMLARKEVPYFTDFNERDEDYSSIPVAYHVDQLDFLYSEDGLKFVDEWDTTSSSNSNKLPKVVKIVLTMKDTKNQEEYFETQINLPITEDINIQPPTKTNTDKTPNSKSTPSSTNNSQNKTQGTSGNAPTKKK